MRVDLKAKKTDTEWLHSWEFFAFSATPVWFQWLGWVFILGALRLLAEKSNSIPMYIILGISGSLFALYFINYFYKFQIENIPFIKSRRIERIISGLITGFLGWGLWMVFSAVIKVFEDSGK